jgi:methionine-rich copper-binding protein CopC
MRLPRFAIPGLACLAVSSGAWAQAIKAMETSPADHATISGAPEPFFVRFDKPVDHIRSRLAVKRGDKIVATLQPRLKTEPQVLFAQSPSLPPGDYTLHWSVKALDGADIVQGKVSFTVAHGKQ